MIEEALANLSVGIDYLDLALRQLGPLGAGELQEARDKINQILNELEDSNLCQ
jgi:hypothetical protein